MKTIIRVLAGFALALGIVLQPSAASAANSLLFRGRGADAHFLRTEGCLITEVFVFVSEIVSRPPKNADPFFEANVVITQYDFCAEEFLLSAEGSAPLTDADFQLSATLESATLNTTVTVVDNLAHISFAVFLDLTWTGSGPLRRVIDKIPGCEQHPPFRATYRFAEASGRVSNGTMNFTPDPSVEGQLYSTKSGIVNCN